MGDRMTAPSERRTSGLLRVPFIQRCQLDFDEGRSASAFLVNLNVLGAYVEDDEALPTPPLGTSLLCRFASPGNAQELHLRAVVVWQNPRQQHPVHSLPPGFGLQFRGLPEEAARRIENIVRDYLARNPAYRG